MNISENHSDTCRACMKKEFGMKCIFNSEVNSVPVSQMLSFTTPLLVRPDDVLPNTLCSKCLQLLISFYKFQQMCIESDQKFRCKPKITTPPPIPPKVLSYLKGQNMKMQSKPTPKLPGPPSSPDDYNSNFQLGWNSSVSCPVVEVSDDEDIVLKFEYENMPTVPVEDNDESDNMIDEYEQFDKLPIIDVRFEEKHKKLGRLNRSDEELQWNNNANISSELHECRICGFKCDHQELLQNHLKTHYVQEMQINSTSKSSSKIMQKTTSPIKLAYICNVCKMAFAGQDRLVMHKKTHEKQGLTRNELTPLNISSYNLECNVCKRFYNNQESYERHACVPGATCSNECSSRNSSYDDSNIYTCNICKRAFQTWEELTKHISEHTIKILYGSDPSSNTTVNVNVNIQTDKTHDCEICKKSFTCWDEFRAHWQQHPENQRGNIIPTQATAGYTVSTSTETYEVATPQVVNDSKDDAVKLFKQQICNVCQRVFNNYANLKRHMKFKHNVVDPQDQELPDINPLDALRAYRICRLYECSICGKTFERQGHLLRHKKTHLKKRTQKSRSDDLYFPVNTKKKYQCDICGIFVINEPNLRRHMKNIHAITEIQVELEGKEINLSDDDDTYACIVCEEELLSRRALIQHLTEHKKETKKVEKEHEETEVGESPVKAKEKEKDEKQGGVQRVTRGKLHAKNASFMCCGRIFTTQGHLNQHKAAHDSRSQAASNPDKSTDCKSCNRKFKTFTHLKQHMLIHKLFECSTCNARFVRKEGLDEHEKTHFNQSKQSPSQSCCPLCKKIFEFKSSQIRHLKKVHGVRIDETDSGNLYNCLICSKSFTNKKHLKDHKKCHDELKLKNSSKDVQEKTIEKEKKTLSSILPYADPHKCLECKIVVSTRACLKKHMKRKHRNVFVPQNSKKYLVQCACSKPFDSQTNLFKHYRAHIVHKQTKKSDDKYVCHFCLLIRPHAWQIRRHMKDSHSLSTEELRGISWQLCKTCKTYFMNSDLLERHIKIKHENASLTKTVFRCKICEKILVDTDLMTKHLLEAHNVEGEKSGGLTNYFEETWPTCRICDRPFANTYSVRRHMENIHHVKIASTAFI